MKYLFWLALIVLVWWAWRRTRPHSGTATPPSNQTPAVPQAMVSCTHCGVHLPRGDAVSGARGPYCSAAHRSAAGDHNPD